MAVRYLTYDIDSEENDYEALYKLLNDLNAEKITESTYKVDTSDLSLDDLCVLLEAATSEGDTVAVIYSTANSITHRVIR